MSIRVYDLAHARAGDKGNTSNISVICYDAKHWDFLERELTPERVLDAFRHIAKGPVNRYPLRNLKAFNFVIENALGGGVTISLAQDIHGKSLSNVMLAIELPIRSKETKSVKASEVVRNVVKEKLTRNEVVASMTIRLSRGVEIAQLAKTAGFDMIYVDMEHSTITLDMTGQICLAALNAGVAPMVRVPANTPDYIQRVLDGGALGIVAPGIGSAAEAREVVKVVKSPPLGERGAGGALPHLQYRSFPTAEANAAVNDATMVIVQFESAAAIERADEIAAVEGVDMVLIGVNDMLASMGLAGQYEHPKVREAYARTIAACRKHGKHVGVGGLSTRPKLAAEFIAMGARLVSTGTDIQFLLTAMTERAKQVHEIPV